nr:RNA-dependent RNA polymerase [Iranian amalgavirus]
MSSSSGAPINYLTMNIQQRRDKYAQMLEVLGQAGVPIQNYLYDEMVTMGYDLRTFENAIKPFIVIKETDTMITYLTLLIQNKVIGAKEHMTFKDLLKAASWLKSTKGREAVANMQHQKKLTAKSRGEMTPEEASLTNVFQQQLVDMAESNKVIRTRFDDKINEYKRIISGLRREKEASLTENRKRFVPSSTFVASDENEVVRECWALYLEDCANIGAAPLPTTEEHMAAAKEKFGPIILARQAKDFVSLPNVKEQLLEYVKTKILALDSANEDKKATYFVASWKSLVESFLLSLPLPLRSQLLERVPAGSLSHWGLGPNRPLKEILHEPSLWSPRQRAIKRPPPISRVIETQMATVEALARNRRVTLLSPLSQRRGGAIPVARSKFEAGVRKIIGGGELRGWREASNMYRGGGCYSDAVKLLATAVVEFPGMTLPGFFSVLAARLALQLPSDLPVPDGPEAVSVGNFNNDATAGPFLRAFGIKSKYGLRDELQQFMWRTYDAFASSERDHSFLPFLTARIGYRTKLVTMAKAWENWTTFKPIGRAVMMLDALEQFSSAPLYNVLSKYCSDRRLQKGFGFKNTVVRASSDWMKIWEEFSGAKAVVELDWKKFDRERPAEDIEFMVDVICSCFTPTDRRKERLLEAYRVMLRRALVERPLITDDGGAFLLDGMVPSGSLWTGWLDTALNILYLTSVCRYLAMPQFEWAPLCAGDDNLTIIYGDYEKPALQAIRSYLNQWYRAGIEEEDFVIHYPPFEVTKEQACFPPGTDLSHGTSKILSLAEWVPFEGGCPIDQAAGRSHRWQYVFRGKPKFLSCYWLPSGMPIRPSPDALEKLLFPEGIHKSMEDYVQAVTSMVVDNPFNSHNVNHMMHRFCIAQQILRLGASGLKEEHIMYLARFRPEEGGEIPFPQVACWRRGTDYVELEDVPFVGIWLKDFKEFCDGVVSLYTRSSQGGLDAWKFSEILRGESDLGEGQFGADISDWCRWLNRNPLTKYLRPVRRFQERKDSKDLPADTLQLFLRSTSCLEALYGTSVMESSRSFALWLCNKIKLKYLGLDESCRSIGPVL